MSALFEYNLSECKDKSVTITDISGRELCGKLINCNNGYAVLQVDNNKHPLNIQLANVISYKLV